MLKFLLKREMSIMSPKFEKVKKYYDSGLWNKKMVANAVVKGWITAEEYQLIVGEPYEA